MLTGHCNHCGKIWMLKTAQGVCRWCGQRSSCQTTRTQALRSIKSRSNDKRKQDLAHSNGYDQLDNKWLAYYQVASKFSHKAHSQDSEDLLHDIIITLADVERNNGHKPFTEAAMYRVASVTVADYWRTQYKLSNGLECGGCSKAQRQKCRSNWLYTECPKAIKLEYLSQPITDGEGNLTELGELIADDRAIDLDAWLDAKTFRQGCPQRLIAIARKKVMGLPLDGKDQDYLEHWRKREQKSLF